MRAMVYDLERKYHEDKRLQVGLALPLFLPVANPLQLFRMQDETIRLQEENLRLRHQLESSSRASMPAPGTAPSTSSSAHPPAGRTVLPPMTAPLPSLTRPASGNAFFPPPPPSAAASRTGTADLDRDAGPNGGEYPNKRMRGGPTAEEDERKRGEFNLSQTQIVASLTLRLCHQADTEDTPLRRTRVLALLLRDRRPDINSRLLHHLCTTLLLVPWSAPDLRRPCLLPSSPVPKLRLHLARRLLLSLLPPVSPRLPRPVRLPPPPPSRRRNSRPRWRRPRLRVSTPRRRPRISRRKARTG